MIPARATTPTYTVARMPEWNHIIPIAFTSGLHWYALWPVLRPLHPRVYQHTAPFVAPTPADCRRYAR